LLLDGIDIREYEALVSLDHSQPHRILGAHPAKLNGTGGVMVRAWQPDAVGAECLVSGGQPVGLNTTEYPGFFAGFVPHVQAPLRYSLRFHFGDGAIWERDDPYRFLPTLGDTDLHLFNEGTHRRLWQHLGAHPREIDGVQGVSFSVWAPNAKRVSVVGDFCQWDGRVFPMRQMGSSGVHEIFIPHIGPGALYKYEIKTQEGMLRLKSDPFAFSCELPPGNASRVVTSSYEWGDQDWIDRRRYLDPRREPMAAYEVHLGSWRKVPEEDHRSLTYRETAPLLVEHMKRFGFTHLELLPVAEYPFDDSWGYQVTGYYAPTSRFGSADDFRYLVDLCHQNGIGVILDWVPAHFPKDDFALRRFDGTPLYEHEDPRLSEHPDWGTLVFNYGRNEVRNFLVANALYWLDEFHIDGLRVDAVASMLYLDYSRKEGEWYPNRYGGRENLEAIDFLRNFNETIHAECPGCFTVAEESTAWTGVTRPVSEGGLGFTFKWNMGWMHDTLLYFSKDPIHRCYHHNDLTFASLYEHTECFIMPLSHDEVVHGKGSLLSKMPGDEWQKFANLRMLYAYQYTRSGKQLLFMGSELASPWEWYHAASLEWHLEIGPFRASLARFLEDLGQLYLQHPCLWRGDLDGSSFKWIHCDDYQNSVLSYMRCWEDEHLVVALNLTPVPRENYRIGVPAVGSYMIQLCSDHSQYGGSDWSKPIYYETESEPSHGFPQSVNLQLPPLAALILGPMH